MKGINIIDRYIFRELLSPFTISLFFLTIVFLMTRIPEIINFVLYYNATISFVFSMVVFTILRFLEFTIPLSVMISILLTFMRMSGENEIIALKGAGMSLYRMLPPILVFCIMGVFSCMWVTMFGVSWGKLSIKKMMVETARSSIDAALQERQFNSELDGVVIYVSSVDLKKRKLKDVFIEDRRTKGIVSISTAPRGQLISVENQNFYTIRLSDGVINQVDMDDNSVNHIRFKEYDINLDLDRMNKNKGKISKELDEKSLVELVRYIKSGIDDKSDLSAALLDLHEKFAIPFACLFLGILAFPLGIQSASLRKSSGFGLGIFFFILYYFLLAAGWSAGETGDYHPVIGMWFPNVIMGGIGIYFLIRNAKEKPVKPPEIISKLLIAVQLKFQRKI